ncbi:uncharacterized protein BO80DRAFT_142403 [Aspergillus ibericus CBS 121593]|uniref:Zn(2)-C6 fungal-type domain-containing protein n=1 Tax=Aspergillus ibericus CBS 121593 TaxID=1448316 RepID=A0A395GTS8_9EURO|nr:hypothetical protein BO80DRAFT_142403 [Aspergillus ibericus CBS 121593]RAK98990.1 hypothetical protein BO80DRAFT_142403 [Aspergillus ibericus CBS 121593]
MPAQADARPRQRRRRVCTACDACHRRKIQCDTVQPRCNWCSHHDTPCTYSRYHRVKTAKAGSAHLVRPSAGSPTQSSRSTGPWSDDQTATDREAPISAGNSAQGIDSSSETPSSDLGGHGPQAFRPVFRMNHISTFNGLPFFSPGGQQWIEKQTGIRINLQEYYASGPPWQVQPRFKAQPKQGQTEGRRTMSLPTRSLLYQFLHAAASIKFALATSLVDEELFECTINAAFDGQLSQTSPAPVSARACILAFSALVLGMVPDMVLAADGDSDDYALAALALLPEVFAESVTVDGLQALLMLAIHCAVSSGDPYTLNMLLSSAARFIFQLGGNLHPSATAFQLPSRADLHVRNLFWTCFLVDKEFCLQTGSPPCLVDTHCDLTVPDGLRHAESLDEGPLWFSALVRLSVIQGHIFDRLYSARALQQNDAELLSTIRTLDTQLEDWRSALPAAIRPALSPSPLTGSSLVDKHSAVLQVQWHYCMMAIHQASCRCITWMETRETHIDGLNSSLTISVQAARMLLRKFCGMHLRFEQDTMRFSLFHISSAVITLFCNVLLRPLNPDSLDDVVLIEGLPHHFQNYDPGTTMVEPFIEYLGHLARCAVVKATAST